MQKPQTELGEVALETLVDTIESYVEFIHIVEYATNFADMPYEIEKRFMKTIKERKKQWEPLLQDLKSDLGRNNI